MLLAYAMLTLVVSANCFDVGRLSASRVHVVLWPFASVNEKIRPAPFYAERPNRLWVADATYIPTWSGFLYLAIVLDVFSRKVVGWAMQNTLHTELMLAAIDMAITIRRPQRVIHHSDHGCQYTSYAFGKRCQEAGIMPSMGTVGDAYDNAMAESFFATLEREVLNRRRFKSQAEAKMAIFDWLEGWYNPHRRHSALGYRSPVNYERRALELEAAET